MLTIRVITSYTLYSFQIYLVVTLNDKNISDLTPTSDIGHPTINQLHHFRLRILNLFQNITSRFYRFHSFNNNRASFPRLFQLTNSYI